VKIPIIFGWLSFHKKEQLCLCSKPTLVCHWIRASWMTGELYSKRLFVIGHKDYKKDVLDYHDAWFNRE